MKHITKAKRDPVTNEVILDEHGKPVMETKLVPMTPEEEAERAQLHASRIERRAARYQPTLKEVVRELLGTTDAEFDAAVVAIRERKLAELNAEERGP